MPMTDRDDVSAWPTVEPRQSFRPYGNRVDSRHMARLGWLRSSFARPRRHDEAGAGPALAVVERRGGLAVRRASRHHRGQCHTALAARARGRRRDRPARHLRTAAAPGARRIERAARRPAVGRFYNSACRLLNGATRHGRSTSPGDARTRPRRARPTSPRRRCAGRCAAAWRALRAAGSLFPCGFAWVATPSSACRAI